MSEVTSDSDQNIHDLAEAIRAVASAIIDKRNGFDLNSGLALRAYQGNEGAAMLIVTQTAAIRMGQIEHATGSPAEPRVVPRDQLTARLPPMRPVPDCLDLLQAWVDGQVLDMQAIEALNREHGVIGFMTMIQVANEIGRMLVEVDPGFTNLSDLLAQEALADESEWSVWPVNGADDLDKPGA